MSVGSSGSRIKFPEKNESDAGEENSSEVGEDVREQEQEATSLDELWMLVLHQRTQVRHQHLRNLVHDDSGIYKVLARVSLPAAEHKTKSEHNSWRFAYTVLRKN